MKRKFAPWSPVPWQWGGLVDPAAPEPDPAQGPFAIEYRDAKGAVQFDPKVDLLPAEAMPADAGIEWTSVIRWARSSDLRRST